MAQVVYDGNGSDGGQVPVDSNTYASGATVNVADNGSTPPHQQNDSNGNPENIVTGNLSRTGAVFLYWSTAANGGGTIYETPATFTFPNQTGNLTLYAQLGVTTGLTGGGVTAAWCAAAGLAGWAIMTVTYVPVLRLYRLSPLRAPGLPVVALLYAAMTVDSARRHYAGRGGEWKGRTIPVASRSR